MFCCHAYINNQYQLGSPVQITKAIMRNSNAKQSGMYSYLLELPNLNQKQISELAMQEDHAVWRSLLKISASNLISDHDQAVTQLRLALSQISSFIRNTTSQQNQRIYSKIVVCVLANLYNRLLALRRFKQAMDYFKQLCQHLHDLTALRQALYNLFGFTSLLALDQYDLHRNCQFKYSKDGQVQFFYMVGKIKMSSGKIKEAKGALEKIVMLSKSMKIPNYLMMRVLEYLTEMDPQRYREQKDQIMKSMIKQEVFFAQQKSDSSFVIKTLLEKQKEFLKQSKKSNGSLTKLMIEGYLKNAMKQTGSDRVSLSELNIQELLQAIGSERNPTVLYELTQQSQIQQQVINLYTSKFDKLKLIILAYYFRKVFNIKPKEKKTHKSPKVSRNTPIDIERAQQILNKCRVGAAIMKVNLGNNSVKDRYLKIEEKMLVWGSSKTQTDSSSCKWKHVLGITYGKVSPNLAKDKFSHLQSWRCFSLITKDRSYDFYCEDQSEVFFWLQGISYQLQLFHQDKEGWRYPFYSKGRALWKMVMMKMASKYLDPKKKYKIKNARAVIEFRKFKSS